MAQTTSYEIANDSGAVVRGRINEVFSAVQSNNAGLNPPPNPAPGMWWLDTSLTPPALRQRNAANTEWVAVAESLNVGRNILINGNFRVNQRGFDGNYAGLSDGDYGFDRWKRLNSNTIRQVVEAGNFEPDTVHTLSGTNITTTQITSPSSGDWNIDVPNNADRVQLEQGTVATPFERRPIGAELALCQRYFEVGRVSNSGFSDGSTLIYVRGFSSAKRVTPTVTLSNPQDSVNVSASSVEPTIHDIKFILTPSGSNLFVRRTNDFAADAEL